MNTREMMVAGEQICSLSKSDSLYCIFLKLSHTTLRLKISPMVDNQLNRHRLSWIMAIDLFKMLPNVSAL